MLLDEYNVVVVGSGNAGMSAAIAAIEKGARVLVIEKGNYDAYAGNTAYSAGTMRCALSDEFAISNLLTDYSDERLHATRFPIYTNESFLEDLTEYNNGRPPTDNQRILVNDSYDALLWLVSKGVKFEPNYDAQAIKIGNEYRFWGGINTTHNRRRRRPIGSAT